MSLWGKAKDACRREADWQRKHRELQDGYRKFDTADSDEWEAHNDKVAAHQDHASRLWRK
jgi:hypothetical protein